MSPPAPRGFEVSEVLATLDRLRARQAFGALTVTLRAGILTEVTLVETQRPGAPGSAGGAPAPVRTGPLVSGSPGGRDG